MTYARREEIFSKETISLSEMAELLDISKSAACEYMNVIRRKVGDRLGIKGKIHIEDYLLFIGETAENKRYQKRNGEITKWQDLTNVS